MFFKIILIFTVIPVLELIILIQLGKYIGSWLTILIVIGTGLLGITLVRIQGLSILSKIKENLYEGQIPAEEFLDGLCVLVGRAMLLTPGLITDTLGFVLVIPGTRNIAKRFMKYMLNKIIKSGIITFKKIG
ncbi:MAG TPA: FxsA family protein [Thermoanaerobacterales bacterium]|nr:FxsA family protein [Thermoanaerobacterales bacterium]